LRIQWLDHLLDTRPRSYIALTPFSVILDIVRLADHNGHGWFIFFTIADILVKVSYGSAWTHQTQTAAQYARKPRRSC
jgi:hypothetical protein